MLAKIHTAKFVVISVDNTTVALGNALYSYCMRLQKKATLFAKEEIEKRFAFLPWHEQIRYNKPTSADSVVELQLDTLALFVEFERELHFLNEKIATSLYASFLIELQQSSQLLQDGMKLATMSQLIELGAKADLCVENIQKREPLSLFRLRSLVFGAFELINSASVAQVSLTGKMLEQTGGVLEDIHKVAKELLCLAHVSRVVVLFENEEILNIEEK